MGDCMNVSIGCGMRKPKGFIGIDIRAYEGVDHVMNIGTEKLPFEDESVSFIESDNVYEHLYPEELFHSINECWRVLDAKGCLLIKVPKAGTPAYYIHPDHKIQFIEDSFGFFQVPADGKDPHGYLNGRFWHVQIVEQDNDQAIWAKLYPNKPNGTFEYKEIEYGDK